MNCTQCGQEIPENSVFCPFCGVPQKVTADYDYIQGKIGANVDKIKTGNTQRQTSETPAPRKKKSYPDDGNDMRKTRNMYGRDTIYEEEQRAPRKPAQQTRKPAKSQKADHRNRYDDYDDYDDRAYRDYRYDYDDWGIEEPRGGNGKTILTTIIIALICLAGIAAVIYFGLKPQERANTPDVVRCFDLSNVEVSEGAEFLEKMEVTLHSEMGYDIHYTLDGSDVDVNSTLYTGTITISDPGTVQIKAQSFDKNGNPSGEGLSKTITIVEEEETTTAAPKEETTTDASEATEISMEEAEGIVEKALVDNGAMNADYTTENGGFINLVHAGEADVNGQTLYVIQADYYDQEGSIWESTYYGVSMDSGDLIYLEKTDDAGYTAVN